MAGNNTMNVHDFALRFIALRTEMSDTSKTDPILARRGGVRKEDAGALSDQRRDSICAACDAFFDQMKMIAQADRFENRRVTHALGIYRESELDEADGHVAAVVDDNFKDIVQTVDKVGELNGSTFNAFSKFVEVLQQNNVMDAAHVGLEGVARYPAARNRTPGIDGMDQDGYNAVKPEQTATKGFKVEGFNDKDLTRTAAAFGVKIDNQTEVAHSDMIDAYADQVYYGQDIETNIEMHDEEYLEQMSKRLAHNTIYTDEQYQFAKAFVNEIANMTPGDVQKELHGMGRSQAVQKLLFRDEVDNQFGESLKHFQERDEEREQAEIQGY